MSYGPQLPPHLQKRQQESSEDEDNEPCGPKLPSELCRGPKPVGPQLPPHLQRRQQDSSEDEDDEPCGPKLPSEPCRGPKPVGPQLPPHLQKTSQESSDEECFGPKLPTIACRGPAPRPTFSPGPQLPEAESSDDDDVIGPLPPKPGQDDQNETSIAKSIELRAQQMKDRLEGREAKAEPKRETWMLELPTEKAKNFGLGPRQFSRSSNPKPKQDKSWTQAPNEGPKEDNEDHSQDEDVLAYMATLRDAEMEKVAEAYKKRRGNESLYDTHTKKMKAKKAEEKKPTERRPFDRNTDLQVNQFDDARKKAMLKKAANLDSRFASGSSKYV